MKTLVVVSNGAWVMPIYIAYQMGSFWWAPALAVATLSVLFHLTENSAIEQIDTWFAFVYILAGPYLLYSVSASVFAWSIVIALAVLSGSLLFVGRRELTQNGDTLKYKIVHSGWHLMSAVTATGIYALYFGWVTI